MSTTSAARRPSTNLRAVSVVRPKTIGFAPLTFAMASPLPQAPRAGCITLQAGDVTDKNCSSMKPPSARSYNLTLREIQDPWTRDENILDSTLKEWMSLNSATLLVSLAQASSRMY